MTGSTELIALSPREKVLADILKTMAEVKLAEKNAKLRKIQEKKKQQDAKKSARKRENSVERKIDNATRDFHAYEHEAYTRFHLTHREFSAYSVEEKNELVNIFYEKVKWTLFFGFGMTLGEFKLATAIRFLKRHGVTNFFSSKDGQWHMTTKTIGCKK